MKKSKARFFNVKGVPVKSPGKFVIRETETGFLVYIHGKYTKSGWIRELGHVSTLFEAHEIVKRNCGLEGRGVGRSEGVRAHNRPNPRRGVRR